MHGQPPKSTDAQLVNIDTKTHVDAKGVEHKYGPHDKAPIGPETVIMMQPHPAMKYKDHVRLNTPVAKHIAARANPHPNVLAKKLAQHVAKAPPMPANVLPGMPPPGMAAPPPGMMAGMPPR